MNPKSIATSSEVHFSNLCHYCQLISDQLIEIKERQVVTDEEYYATSHPEARTSAAWPRPGRKMRAFHHYQIESELKASVEAGCALCARLLEGDRYGEDRKYSDVPLDEMTGFLTFGPSKHQEDEWQVKLRLGWDPGHVRIVYVKAIHSPEVKYPNPSINTRDGLKLAKAWLEECKTHHSCLKSSDATVSMLPTRLLDISTDQVRLCLSEKLDPQTNYATLSHCWGTGKYLKLKTENIKLLMDCVPGETLPQTFQDSIYIARYLGLKYIWIDSLCIVQDDANDWALESALMSQVYGLSTINIAASGAADGSKGCFFGRPGTWNCLLKGKSASEPLVAYSRPALWGRLRMMPLSKRGWVVQERVLPRRTIFFTQKELFWECDERGACETFPDQCPKELYDRDVVIGMKRRPMRLENWDEFVRLYTSSDLTMSKDKLIAIAGIAQAVHEEIKDRYVAGLWRTDLEHQLLWKNVYAGLESSDKGFRHREYRAPSWSWAAIDGVIDLQRFNTQPLMIKIQEITLQHSPPKIPSG